MILSSCQPRDLTRQTILGKHGNLTRFSEHKSLKRYNNYGNHENDEVSTANAEQNESEDTELSPSAFHLKIRGRTIEKNTEDRTINP